VVCLLRILVSACISMIKTHNKIWGGKLLIPVTLLGWFLTSDINVEIHQTNSLHV